MSENKALVDAAKEAVELQRPIEVTTIPTDETSTSKLTEESGEEEVFVVARSLKEMNIAQAKLVTWATSKIAKAEADIKEAQSNLDIAKKRKWSTEPFKRLVSTATKKKEYYEKAKAALEAGYTIIPNMPMDVFAIRTSRKTPVKKLVSSDTRHGRGAVPNDQETNSPPLKQGTYVSPIAKFDETHWEGKDREGKPLPMVKRWAAEWDENIDFPFRTAKPEVLNATAQALVGKIFDELGAAPATYSMRRMRGDPMVIGSIVYNPGGNEKRLSFLVSWFIDSRDL